MSQNYFYPPSGGGSSTNAANGTVGNTAPTTATEVAGVNGSGNLTSLVMTVTGALKVDNSAVTQPISVSTLPLPTGAATETTLAAVNTKLAGTLAVSAASLPLPSGAATETTLAAVNTKLAGTLAVSAASLPLPSGAATETTLSAVNTKLAGTLAVSVADLTASGNITTQNLNGTGAATAGSAVALSGLVNISTIGVQVVGTYTGALTVQGSLDGTNWYALQTVLQVVGGAIVGNIASGTQGIFIVPTGPISQVRVVALAAVTGTAAVLVRASTATPALAGLQSGTNTIGALSANQSVNLTQLVGTALVANSGPATAGSPRVTISNTATATVTSVASSATSVSLLASTSGRAGATFYNDSTAILYLKFGTTASTSSYTVQIPAGGYYELPPSRVYSGAIDGIWSAANGNVRITELT